jgi:hypothetical protein
MLFCAAMRERWIIGLLAALPGCGAGGIGSSALLVTLDTTRADAVGAYGGAPRVTPHVDRLAREGITYAVAYSVAPLTLPAHASMLTGLYPPRHGVRADEPAALPEAAVTLAEAARAEGLETAAFVASRLLSQGTGIDQGFDTWDEPEREALGAEEVGLRAARWLRARSKPGSRFFLWVHFFDPHLPWDAPGPFLEQAGGDPYLAEVARADAALGLLVEELRTLGLLERTAIAVVGDHGEPRGEHGERTHGHFVYEAALRVPFVIRPPAGGVGSERRRSADRGVASVVDVAPTLAHAMGLGPLVASDGIDLLAGAIPAERSVYFECQYGFLSLGWSPLAGWADARAKYVHSSEPELYVPEVWPDERVNRIHERAAEELAGYRARLAELASGPALAPAPDRSLEDPLAETGLPSPHSRAGELGRCDQARSLILEGRKAEALAILREIAAANPGNAWALETLAAEGS